MDENLFWVYAATYKNTNIQLFNEGLIYLEFN